MSGRDGKGHAPWVAPILAFVLILKAKELFAGAEPARIEVGDPAALSGLSELLSTAVRDAMSKLSDTACSRIFSDFRDSRGRTLQQNLDALEQTGQRYLARLNFYDGYGKSRCAERGTLAATSPGSRVIYICSPQFSEKQHRDPGLAAALVIHEALHSLGLAENPPTSQAITAQVISRCGR